ncbi:MAG: hypothetical protein FWD57_15935, partial [Polyangiaceae bacterium]|nr:hypothetical protein [Polyangiaceae bacterium]
ARGTNDKPTHLSIPPNAVRLIPFHYIFVTTDGTVGAGLKPARIIAAPVVARIIAASAIASYGCQASPHPDTAIVQLALSCGEAPHKPLGWNLESGGYSIWQYSVKGYPGARQQAVLRGMGDQAIVASISPGNLRILQQSSIGIVWQSVLRWIGSELVLTGAGLRVWGWKMTGVWIVLCMRLGKWKAIVPCVLGCGYAIIRFMGVSPFGDATLVLGCGSKKHGDWDD